MKPTCFVRNVLLKFPCYVNERPGTVSHSYCLMTIRLVGAMQRRGASPARYQRTGQAPLAIPRGKALAQKTTRWALRQNGYGGSG